MLQLDDLDMDTTASKSNKTTNDLDIIDEEFDDYEDTLKQMDTEDIETMQIKLGVEL